MAINLKAKKLLHNGLLIVSALVLVAIVVFYTGYQLAIYQMANFKSLWPHMNIGISQDLCTNGQPYCNTDYNGNNNASDCSAIFCGGSSGSNFDEPVINLYPTKSEEVNVRLDVVPGLRETVPTYHSKSGWSLLVSPNGSLTDLTTGKTYPYLIWESKPVNLNADMRQGFVVSGSETRTFLQRELPVIGLSPKETDAFIVYWLPRMKANRYNLIHFDETKYTSIAKLHITPAPDALLRVLMVYQPVPLPVHVTMQTFPPFYRHGFTAVEWGGTELH
jgi:hypothetical protein